MTGTLGKDFNIFERDGLKIISFEELAVDQEPFGQVIDTLELEEVLHRSEIADVQFVAVSDVGVDVGVNEEETYTLWLLEVEVTPLQAGACSVLEPFRSGALFDGYSVAS